MTKEKTYEDVKNEIHRSGELIGDLSDWILDRDNVRKLLGEDPERAHQIVDTINTGLSFAKKIVRFPLSHDLIKGAIAKIVKRFSREK